MNEILNPTKYAKNKVSNFPQYCIVILAPVGIKQKFENFLILLDSDFSPTIVIDEMTSKLKWKVNATTE